MEEIFKIVDKINRLDSEAMAAAADRQDKLTKPQGSLGALEELSVKLAGISGKAINDEFKKVVIVMVGDHGVTESAVSAYPKEVTPQMVYNFISGGAAINVLSKHIDALVKVVDIGVDADIDSDEVINKKIAKGTKNMAEGPAMTRDEAERSILAGIEVVEEEIKKGANLVATGDMGIGNTTASTAVLAAFTGLELEAITGRGTGISDEIMKSKTDVIRKALIVNEPNSGDPIDVLSKVGGFEIGGLAGVILGSAKNRVPIVIDGFISGAAALTAAKIAPDSIDYMIASHISEEPGHGFILRELGLTPMLHLKMRLGEGTGAVLAMSIVEAAAKIIDQMATFEEANVSKQMDSSDIELV